MIKHKYLVLLWKAVVIAAVVLTPANALAQEQNAQPQSDSGEKVNTFAIDAELMTRSELRMGGLPDNEEDHDNKAYFILERTRLGLDYERSFIKAHVTGQHSAIWGQAGKGSFNL